MSTLTAWENTIVKAYLGRNRSKLWLVAALNQEAGELAELVIKREGYDKYYSKEQVLSEAGDVLNLLTAILQAHDLTLHDAAENNIAKLETRGWLPKAPELVKDDFDPECD